MIRLIALLVLLPAISAHAGQRCTAPPLAESPFLRGTMTTWTPREDLQFRWRCDAYVLNVNLSGAHEFRITDARFGGSINFGAASAQPLQADRPLALAKGRSPNLHFTFGGEHAV